MQFPLKLESVVGKVVGHVVVGGAKRAVKYVSPNFIVRATLVGKRRNAISSSDVRVKVGKPNYLERKFIKLALAADEQFPIKKIQLKYSKN